MCLHLSYLNTFLSFRWGHGVLLFVEFYGILGSYSRCAWGVAVVLIAGALLFFKASKRILLPAIICFSTFLSVPHLMKEQTLNNMNVVNVPRIVHRPLDADTHTHRLRTYQSAVQMIQEKPLLGHGLGAFLTISHEVLGYKSILHNTSLWLLLELGLIGFFWFMGFFLFLGWQFLTHYRSTKDPVSHAMLMVLFTFFTFSLVHEMMYQRILWVILGLGMCALRSEKGRTS